MKRWLKISLIIMGIFILITAGILFYMNKRINTPGPEPMTDEACEIVGGTLIEEYRECEGISAQTCKNIGGTFNECASACRHNPEAEICTMQCIPVCSF